MYKLCLHYAYVTYFMWLLLLLLTFQMPFFALLKEELQCQLFSELNIYTV